MARRGKLPGQKGRSRRDNGTFLHTVYVRNYQYQHSSPRLSEKSEVRAPSTAEILCNTSCRHPIHQFLQYFCALKLCTLITLSHLVRRIHTNHLTASFPSINPFISCQICFRYEYVVDFMRSKGVIDLKETIRNCTETFGIRVG